MNVRIRIPTAADSTFMDHVRRLLPEGGNLNLCLTCGACASGCPPTGLEGMDEEIAGHPLDRLADGSNPI